jgi:hypothetical protein
MKILLTGISTAVFCFTIAAGTGLARGQRTQVHYYTARIGDGITVPGDDLFCAVMRRDPDHNEAGPIMYCARHSVTGSSRAVVVSRYHYGITTEDGSHAVYRVGRTP